MNCILADLIKNQLKSTRDIKFLQLKKNHKFINLMYTQFTAGYQLISLEYFGEQK